MHLSWKLIVTHVIKKLPNLLELKVFCHDNKSPPYNPKSTESCAHIYSLPLYSQFLYWLSIYD